MDEQLEEKYSDLLNKLKEKVESIEEELEELEESGKADEYPVKHQKAIDMIEEINNQIADLSSSFNRFETE